MQKVVSSLAVEKARRRWGKRNLGPQSRASSNSLTPHDPACGPLVIQLELQVQIGKAAELNGLSPIRMGPERQSKSADRQVDQADGTAFAMLEERGGGGVT